MFSKISSFSLTFFIFLSSPIWGDCGAYLHAEKAKACSVSPLNKGVLEEVSSLHQDSVTKTEKLLQDKDFQEFVAQIGAQESGRQGSGIREDVQQQPFNLTPDSKILPTDILTPDIYIFVSFSLGEKALLQLAMDAKHYGATLVLRGFKDGSYVKTAQALQKIIQKTESGILIDPELFNLFEIKAVPTFILSKPFPIQATDRIQTPLHDRLQGHVSLIYALETFAQQGDLKNEAEALLKHGKTKNKKPRSGEEK